MNIDQSENKIGNCEHCGKQFEGNQVFITFDNKFICKECARNSHVCENCGRMFMNEDYEILPDIGRVCPNCFKKGAFHCPECGNVTLWGDAYQIKNGELVCADCLKEYLFSEYSEFFEIKNMKRNKVSNLEKFGDLKRYRMIYDVTITAEREVDAIERLGIEYDPDFMKVMGLLDCVGSNCKTFDDGKKYRIKDSQDIKECEYYQDGKCKLPFASGIIDKK